MFFGVHPDLLAMVENLSDDELHKLKRGGHDPLKVYTAYNAAMHHKGQPTVVLAKTIKGYGLGEAGEGRNISHQQKKLNEEELKVFRDRFEIPIKDEELAEAPFYRPSEDSEEFQYIQERRKALGGFVPNRSYKLKKLPVPGDRTFRPIFSGSSGREISTTMSFGRLLSQLMRDKEIGEYIVPIVPDEARTFGLDSLFRQYGIYSHVGQKYQPVDFPGLLYYREATDGQLLEEGITEAGAMCSFIAAATSYSFHNRPMIPFFIYYSMFGFQRIGDLIWAAADQRARGFLLGATAGRTTLAGEGLQHQDGHSHLAASTVPNLLAYDPAFGYELAVIVRDGIRRMYHEDEDVFYYITVMNENYDQPELPEGVEEGILKGMYLFKPSENREDNRPRIRLLGSGAILMEALRAQSILESQYGVSADVWSVTSYKELAKDGIAADRHNRLHPESDPKIPYVTELLSDEQIPTVAASDNVRILPESVRGWIPGSYSVLGTDGFGRSEARKDLRRFFEVDAEFITLAALTELAKKGDLPKDVLGKAISDLDIDPEKIDPFYH
jgi:pyruvate dehydrogenase E1 component